MRGWLLLLAAAPLMACAAEEACLDPLPEDCTPEYPATFADVHARTLVPSCAVAGGACHASDGQQGGLDLSEIEAAYAALTQAEAFSEAGPRVRGGDAECSLLVRRIESTMISNMMPPGAPLREGTRCAIATWIREGAAR